jgi:transposase
MSFRLRPGHRIFVFSEYVDLRAGFNKLGMIVRERIQAKLVDGDLFLFMGRNRKKIKGIIFDGTGLMLIAKRLDHGCFMKLEQLESPEITADELDNLLRGSVIKRTHFGEEILTRRQNQVNLQRNVASGVERQS